MASSRSVIASPHYPFANRTFPLLMDPQYATGAVVSLLAGIALLTVGFALSRNRAAATGPWAGLGPPINLEGVLLGVGLIALVLGLVLIVAAYSQVHVVHEVPVPTH